jgi:hypothetical protein
MVMKKIMKELAKKTKMPCKVIMNLTIYFTIYFIKMRKLVFRKHVMNMATNFLKRKEAI